MMTTRANNGADWRSFDAVAEIYDRVMVPIYFERPAADLVDACNPKAGDRVLDVGTGTGVTAEAAKHAVGSRELIVGVDPSLGMLQRARLRGLSHLVSGRLPHLPFPDSAFDVVMSSFVLANVPDYRAGLSEMIRVTKQGGTIGVTTWGPDVNEFGQLWKKLFAAFISPQEVQAAKDRQLPWQEHFTHKANLQQALEDAGLKAVTVSERVHHLQMKQDEYLISRQSFAEGRLLRHLLGEARWDEFCRVAAEEFGTQYGQGIEYKRSAYFGVARKPA